MPALYYCEIEFVNAEGQTVTRSFSRAHTVVFDNDRVDIREGDSRFFIRGTHRINYFESGPLANRLNSRDRDELYREVATLCGESRRIPAIKLVRDTLGYGLKEAKAYVDDNFPREPFVRRDDIPY